VTVAVGGLRFGEGAEERLVVPDDLDVEGLARTGGERCDVSGDVVIAEGATQQLGEG